jgi:hypothetical protein
MKKSTRLLNDHLRNWMPFLKITFGDRFYVASSTSEQFEFPPEIKSVLHPGVHSLTAGWAMNMGGIS